MIKDVTESLSIRAVTSEDAAQLQANCFPAVAVEQVRVAITNALVATANGKEYQLVTEVGGQVIGSATLIRKDHTLRSHRAGLFGLVVHPAYQRQGLGKTVVLAACRRLQELGMETVLLGTGSWNTAMLRCAEAAGYQRFYKSLWYSNSFWAQPS